MAVVEIAHVGMAVLDRLMRVFMGMPQRRSPWMLMLVMGIGILPTVLMAVVVMHRRVVMPVAVVITDQQDHVRLKPAELAGEFNKADADGFCHADGRGTFQFNEDLAVHLEPVLFDEFYWLVESLQNHGSGGYEI